MTSPRRLWSLCVLALFLSVARAAQDFRQDGKCGPGNLAPSGSPSKCQHIPPFPTCCQKNGHCGWDCEGGDAVLWNRLETAGGMLCRFSVADSSPQPRPPPAASAPPPPSFVSNGLYRSDGRCGQQAPLDDGLTPAECDPNSQFWCCSGKFLRQ